MHVFVSPKYWLMDPRATSDPFPPHKDSAPAFRNLLYKALSMLGTYRILSSVVIGVQGNV